MSVPPLLSWIPHRARARWSHGAPRSRVVELDSYTIHSVEFGTGDEVLVLLHGLSGSGRWWSRNVAGLAETYRVVIPDLVGFGSSPATERVPDLDESANLLVEWMDHIGVERIHLVGHSMGGQIGIHFAARFPDRLDRLVLVDAAGIPRPLVPSEVARFALDIAPLWRWGDPRFLPVIIGDALLAGPRTILRAIAHILRDDVRPLLHQVVAPTLVIWGERDNWIPLTHAWELRQAIPRAELAVLRGTSHNPMVDRPADFNRLVLRFLAGERVGR